MHSLRQRWISSGSSSVSSSSVVAARSLTLQLQDIHVKQRRGTASQRQAFRVRHSRLNAVSRNLKGQSESTLMAWLLTTLGLWTLIGSWQSALAMAQITVQTYSLHRSYCETGRVSQRVEGRPPCGAAVAAYRGEVPSPLLSRAFFPPWVCHLATPHL